MKESENLKISVEALNDWKNKCEVDSCEPTYRENLILGAYIAWQKYSKKIWTEKIKRKGEEYKRYFCSDIQDMFLKSGKIKTHPFHVIEEVLYNKKRKNGQPYKEWLIDMSLEKNAGWLITVLFKQTLFKDFIQKQAKKAILNESLTQEGVQELSIDNSEMNDCDQIYLQNKLKKMFESISEIHKVACYYRLKSFCSLDYKLSVDEIYQIVGVRKVFYDYSKKIFEDWFKQLKQDDFEVGEILSELEIIVYEWASLNNLCKALDEKVVQKKDK